MSGSESEGHAPNVIEQAMIDAGLEPTVVAGRDRPEIERLLDSVLSADAVAAAREERAEMHVIADEHHTEKVRLHRELIKLHTVYQAHFRDRVWCTQDATGLKVCALRDQLHTRLDQLEGVTPDNPYRGLIRIIRSGIRFAELRQAVLIAGLYVPRWQKHVPMEIISMENAGVEPILIEVSDEWHREQVSRNPEAKKYFFKASDAWFYPLDYETRPQVREIVGALQRLHGRSVAANKEDRKRQRALLEQFEPHTEHLGMLIDASTARQLSDPYECAFYVHKLKLQHGVRKNVVDWSGVLHVRFEAVPGRVEKQMTVIDVVGGIERIYGPGTRIVWELVREPEPLRPSTTNRDQALLAYLEASAKRLADALGRVESAQAADAEQVEAAKAEIGHLLTKKGTPRKQLPEGYDAEGAVARAAQLQEFLDSHDPEAIARRAERSTMSAICGLERWQREVGRPRGRR
jgi:hypothetical protein